VNDVRPPSDTEPRKRVRVWFGDHTIADYTGDEAAAARFASSMQRRFAGLRVTTDPVPHHFATQVGASR
jgi:hypothetical protein